ncbi:MAG: AMP-binding protein, partial [Pseudomonadales bacterium]
MEFHFGNAWTALAQALGEAPALVCEGQTRSWAEFEDRAGRLASALAAAGLNPGSKLGLYLLNCNEYTEAHFGAFKLGACPINVNYRYQADELVYLLENSDAEAVLFHSRFADRIEEIRPRLPGVKLYLQVDDGTEAPLLAGAVAFEAALAEAAPGTWAPRPADDIYMLYTGGTTGMPKGVMYENGAFCAAMAAA